MSGFQLMRTPAVQLNHETGLWLHYASVQHKLRVKRAALHALQDKVKEGEQKRGFLEGQNRKMVFECGHFSNCCVAVFRIYKQPNVCF